MLQLLTEEKIAEDRLQRYFEGLYRVVCVSERLSSGSDDGNLMKCTYVVDWEQLVHLLETYGDFGEDIVEVAKLSEDESRIWRQMSDGMGFFAHA